ncbi:MAG: translation initiation factor IF-2 subunit alpha [Candidatus Micrarchaeota archaeon]
MRDTPEQDELVLATVKKILPYGAFCTLDEYNNREAFLHISEVASRWIKNIHEFLRDNQKIVARVYRFIPEKNQIDLSLKRVTEMDRKRKLEHTRREKRGKKLLELAAKKVSRDTKGVAAPAEIEEQLAGEFGDVYTALEELSLSTESALRRIKLGEEWRSALLEVAQQNIKKTAVSVERVIVLNSNAREGISEIKTVLSGLEQKAPSGSQLSITYLGAPRYMLTMTADDYKTAERLIQTAISDTLNEMKGRECVLRLEDKKEQET